MKRRSTSPSQSLHARSFSTIHAASPIGESWRAKARVCGFVRWTEMPRGGHFAAFEEPELYAEDLRAFFRPYR